MFTNTHIHPVKVSWTWSPPSISGIYIHTSTHPQPHTKITVFFHSASSPLDAPQYAHAHICVCVGEHTYAASRIKCQTQSFHPSIYHTSFNLSHPLSLSLVRTHAATAVGFHLIPLSSHVITALNSGPRRVGARPLRVFTDHSIWTP